MNYFYKYTLITVILVALMAGTNAQLLPDNFPDSLSQYEGKELAQALADLTWQYREKNTDLSIQFAMEGIRIAEAGDYKEQLAKLYNFLGVVYQHYKNDNHMAIPYYNRGMKISLQIKDSVEIGYVFNNLGDAFYEIGNIPLAKQYADKSMRMFLKLNDSAGIAYSCTNKGVIYRKTQQYDSALFYFRKSIDIREKLNDSITTASAVLEIAKTFKEKQDYDSAVYFYRKSINLHSKLNNRNYIAYSQIGLGDCYLYFEKYDSALISFNAALAHMIERDNVSGIVASQLGIGKAYMYSGMTDHALNVYNEVLAIAKARGKTLDVLKVYYERAEFLYSINDKVEAYKNMRQYAHISDSLSTRIQLQTLSEVENRFRITEELNEVNEDLDLKKQSQIYLTIIIGLLLLIIFGLFILQRDKGRLNKKLQKSMHLKNKIFSIISHDLISPFNVLVGYSQLLKEELNQNRIDQAKEFADIIYEKSDETSRLTRNMLDWAQAQRERIELKPKKFSVSHLISDSEKHYRHAASIKGLSIELDCLTEKEVYADRELVLTALNNFLGNAIKYTNEGGKIVIGCNDQD
ncbi:MAG TPA: tetratricopeptide repeat-containing sensor histidine kinase, partial [Bacteroidales bacterium]|nr:tetratricopeptide repeat-containing sensor histidine kinase [Bacteroidales bacterium]